MVADTLQSARRWHGIVRRLDTSLLDKQHTNEELQKWPVGALFISPGPHFSQGRLRAEEPLRYWQLSQGTKCITVPLKLRYWQVTVTGNEMYYCTSEIEIMASYCHRERNVLLYL